MLQLWPLGALSVGSHGPLTCLHHGQLFLTFCHCERLVQFYVPRNSCLLHLIDWKRKESCPFTGENWRNTLKPPSIFFHEPPAIVTFPEPAKLMPASGPLLLQFPLPGMLFLLLLLFIIPVSAPSHPSPKNLPSQNQAAATPAVSSTLALFYYFPILCPSLKWSLLVYLFIASKCMRTGTAIGMHNIICLIILKYFGNVSQRSLGVW